MFTDVFSILKLVYMYTYMGKIVNAHVLVGYHTADYRFFSSWVNLRQSYPKHKKNHKGTFKGTCLTHLLSVALIRPPSFVHL